MSISSEGFLVRRTIAGFAPMPSMPFVSVLSISIETSSIEMPSWVSPLKMASSTDFPVASMLIISLSSII